MMCAVSWFSVRPGFRNFHELPVRGVADGADDAHAFLLVLTFLTARASIIGVMPSVQSIFASSKIWIMLMSMKSTPSFMPSTPRFLHLLLDGVGELRDLLAARRVPRRP